MLSFTFTSKDSEGANVGKTTEEKIFPRVGNVRIAAGLMQKDKPLLPDWNKVSKQLVIDAERGISAILKNENEYKTILHSDSIKAPTNESNPLENSTQEKTLVTDIGKELKTQGLSEQQGNDFKFMTNQGNIGSIAAELVEYFNQKDIFQDAEERAFQIQNMGGSLYGMCASYEIASKDNIIIIAEVDLGPLGSENYIPKMTRSILAEGKIAEQILGQIKGDIQIPKNHKSKSAKEIKAEYEEIVVKTLQATGYEEQFQKTVKSDIELILSHSRLSDNPASHRSKLGAIKEFKSTPKLFAEVLVDKIDEVLVQKNKTPEEIKESIQALSNNASQLFDQPEGYMNILIKDIARDRATKIGQELPKEKFIQRVKGKLNLIFAKFQSKTASQNIKIIREANKAKSQGQSR